MTARDYNLILDSDSYKPTHYRMLMPGTTGVYSYWESREGATYPDTTLFGLQYIVKKYLAGTAVVEADVQEAFELLAPHFGDPAIFNMAGWLHIINDHNCRLPLRIKAVPEGMAVPVGNVMMTVENTCPRCAWLTNYVETLLCRLWYPSNVATISGHTIAMIRRYVVETGGSPEAADFMLHDFGSRGASTAEAAALGGAAHLIHSKGTDTMSAMKLLRDYYDAQPGMAMSVPASEHSVMTQRGREGEAEVLDHLLDVYPTGILSAVGDSYDIDAFVRMQGEPHFYERILERDGKLVTRPDSGNPVAGTLEVLDGLWDIFGGTENAAGYRVLDSHVGALWGDAIGPPELEPEREKRIDHILDAMMRCGYAATNLVFGMGGGLLQKHNRDTQRDAFKASAVEVDGAWRPVHKEPVAGKKASKPGRLKLVNTNQGPATVTDDAYGEGWEDLLELVFEDGELKRDMTFDEVRAQATREAVPA